MKTQIKSPYSPASSAPGAKPHRFKKAGFKADYKPDYAAGDKPGFKKDFKAGFKKDFKKEGFKPDFKPGFKGAKSGKPSFGSGYKGEKPGYGGGYKGTKPAFGGGYKSDRPGYGFAAESDQPAKSYAARKFIKPAGKPKFGVEAGAPVKFFSKPAAPAPDASPDFELDAQFEAPAAKKPPIQLTGKSAKAKPPGVKPLKSVKASAAPAAPDAEFVPPMLVMPGDDLGLDDLELSDLESTEQSAERPAALPSDEAPVALESAPASTGVISLAPKKPSPSAGSPKVKPFSKAQVEAQAQREAAVPTDAVADPSATFASYGLRAPLLRALTELGYAAPTPIQAQTLPILLKGPTDLMGLAATGTGKTAAFAIPVLEKIDADSRETQCLVLCPTRELVLQVAEQFKNLGKHLGVRVLTIFGGAGYGEQMAGIRSGAHVIVATPGRLVDLLTRDKLRLDLLETLILDEADEMVSMGFKEELEAILEKAPGTQKNWLFSATMSPAIRGIADRFLKSPATVQINRKEMLSGTVEQYYIPCHEYDKVDVIGKLIDAEDDFYGLVFCQTKALVVDVHSALRDRGYAVDCLHGDMDQAARETTMRGFRAKKSRILICTDVASRGLDVKELSHVINFSLPRELDNYVHRIGRTGRAGKAGVAISLVTPSHRGLIYRIEKLTRTEMKLGKLPTRRDIAKKRATRLMAEFADLGAQTDKTSPRARALEVLADVWTDEMDQLPAKEVAARFMGMAMMDLLADRPAQR